MAEKWLFDIRHIMSGAFGSRDPHFGERRGRRVSSIVPLEKAMVISYWFSIVIIALSLTIRRQFAVSERTTQAN